MAKVVIPSCTYLGIKVKILDDKSDYRIEVEHKMNNLTVGALIFAIIVMILIVLSLTAVFIIIIILICFKCTRRQREPYRAPSSIRQRQRERRAKLIETTMDNMTKGK